MSHWYSFFYCSRHTEWIPPTSHQVTNLSVCLVCSSFCSFKVLNWTPAFVHFEPTRWGRNLLCFIFLYLCSFPHFKTNQIDSVYLHYQMFQHFVQTSMRSVQSYKHYIYARCCPGQVGRWNLIVACGMLKPVYFAFVKTMLEFLQTTHFVKSRAHLPRPTRKIIAMIALRHAILMRADPVVKVHVHCLFRGRARSCKNDTCLNSQKRPGIKLIHSGFIECDALS